MGGGGGGGAKPYWDSNQWSPLPCHPNKDGRATDSCFTFFGQTAVSLLSIAFSLAVAHCKKAPLWHLEPAVRLTEASPPLLFSVETRSVSVVVDIEAGSHPNLPSVRQTDEPKKGRISCLWLFHHCSDDRGRRSLVAISIGLRPPILVWQVGLAYIISSDYNQYLYLANATLVRLYGASTALFEQGLSCSCACSVFSTVSGDFVTEQDLKELKNPDTHLRDNLVQIQWLSSA